MAKTLVAALCVLVLLATIIATISDAKAGGRTWHRSGTVKGPRGGTTTFQRYGACQDGTCVRGGTAIGPGGGVRSWSNTRTCAGGSCAGSGTYVGPGGKVVTRSGTATYGNGGWQAQGTVTGPRGGTGNYQASGLLRGRRLLFVGHVDRPQWRRVVEQFDACPDRQWLGA
jgi:hypothetical protein